MSYFSTHFLSILMLLCASLCLTAALQSNSSDGSKLLQLDIFFHVISDGHTPELDSTDGWKTLRSNVENQINLLNQNWTQFNISFRHMAPDYHINKTWFNAPNGTVPVDDMMGILHNGTYKDLNIYLTNVNTTYCTAPYLNPSSEQQLRDGCITHWRNVANRTDCDYYMRNLLPTWANLNITFDSYTCSSNSNPSTLCLTNSTGPTTTTGGYIFPPAVSVQPEDVSFEAKEPVNPPSLDAPGFETDASNIPKLSGAGFQDIQVKTQQFPMVNLTEQLCSTIMSMSYQEAWEQAGQWGPFNRTGPQPTCNDVSVSADLNNDSSFCLQMTQPGTSPDQYFCTNQKSVSPNTAVRYRLFKSLIAGSAYATFAQGYFCKSDPVNINPFPWQSQLAENIGQKLETIVGDIASAITPHAGSNLRRRKNHGGRCW